MNNSITTSTRSLTVLAPAKLNLTFEILAKRPDHFHELLTFFQTIDLCDELRFRFRPDQNNHLSLTVASSHEHEFPQKFPLDDSNLIARAAHLFWALTGKLKPVHVEVSIVKNIPIGAGLAGGSANAAAALLALNEYYGAPLNLDRLLEIAAKLGSDIPFCISGGSRVGRGRGELLTPVESSCQLHFVIVKPKHLSVLTEWAFKTFAEREWQAPCNPEHAEANIVDVVCHLQSGDLEQFAKRLGNAFEPLVFARYPLLLALQKQLLEWGCLCVHMTGSGPTMYGLAKTAKEAQNIAALLLAQNGASQKQSGNEGEALDIWVARAVNHGVKVIADESGA